MSKITGTHVIGFAVGVVMLITPEPVSSAMGIGIMAWTAFKMGWLGKP